MRVFVGYGYNERDKWVENYVVPMLVAFGCEVLHGKAVFGGALQEEVIKLIRSADAMLGFTTRRDPAPDGKFHTHGWVVQELTAAHTHNPVIPWVEIREDGVVPPGGILEAANTQRIDYSEDKLAQCLVKIAEALKRLRDLTRLTTVRLGPSSAVEQISPLLDDPTFTCTCQTVMGVVRTTPRPIQVLPIKGALFAQIRGLSEGELVRIMIAARGRVWRSDYDSVDTVDMQVKE